MVPKKIFDYFRTEKQGSGRCHAIIDRGNDSLIAIGVYLPAVVVVNEWLMDGSYVPDIVSPQVPMIRAGGASHYPEWSWSYAKWHFKKTDPAFVTDEARARAVLFSKKIEGAAWVIRWVNRLRAKTYTGLLQQDVIYAEKEREAKLVKDTPNPEDIRREIPFLAQYADSEHISLEQAADDVILQAQLDREHLAKTEKIRMALLHKIKDAKDGAEIDDTIRTYRHMGLV